MDTTTQRLSTNDLSSIRALNEVFSRTFDDPESYHNHLPSDAYLTQFLADEKHIVLIAKQAEKVVGGLVAYQLDKFESERREIFIYDLAVDPAFQRQGIGKKLIESLKLFAKEIGAYTVFVQADEKDEAIKFYEALGPSENLKTRNFDFEI